MATCRAVLLMCLYALQLTTPNSAQGVAGECGRSNHSTEHFHSLSGRIVGGVDAQKNEWPWQISLQLVHPRSNKPQHFCGGVLIDDQHVLTAGHCIKNHLSLMPNPSMWRVIIGEHRMKQSEGPEKTVTVSRVVPYPWYFLYDNDIAMVKLSEKVQLSEKVAPACLPTADMNFVGTKCVATGWGKLDFEMIPTSEILKEVELDVFDNSVCAQAYRRRFSITIQPWHLCAGTLTGGKGTCQGDSGGPFVCKKDDRWYVAGLTSFGAGCAKPGFPDVYTRVSYYLNWINQQKKL